ncbi:MAG TPA: cupin domain-containing protein [Gaiellaceae bacterium]
MTLRAVENLACKPGDGATVHRMKTFNLNSDEWDGEREREGWRGKGVLVGRRVGGELIGATMSEVESGSKLWPYHTHYLNEEWVIVLRGEPTLRTSEGEQVLKEGDVVCFPRGKRGAHQIINRTDAPIRVLMLSSMIPGEIIEYLDTGKVLAKDVEDEDIVFARPGPPVEYWEGEE